MIFSFPPIIDQNATTLILGTMPGAQSLAKHEYYGNKSNAFWRILFSVFGALPVPEDFQLKKNLLLENQIALWDVLQNCERQGSLDLHIKNHKENDFDAFFSEFPNIQKILFNGKESHKFFTRKFGQIPHLSYHVLPSTSPANTMRFEQKLEAWKAALI